jgi:hypothetical protein
MGHVHIFLTIVKSQFDRKYDSGSVARGNRKGTKKSALPKAATAISKGKEI